MGSFENIQQRYLTPFLSECVWPLQGKDLARISFIAWNQEICVLTRTESDGPDKAELEVVGIEGRSTENQSQISLIFLCLASMSLKAKKIH